MRKYCLAALKVAFDRWDEVAGVSFTLLIVQANETPATPPKREWPKRGDRKGDHPSILLRPSQAQTPTSAIQIVEDQRSQKYSLIHEMRKYAK